MKPRSILALDEAAYVAGFMSGNLRKRERCPLKGFDSGVMEIVLRHRGDAFRVIALQIGADVWVVHAFQKKSTQGIKTPLHEIELVRERIKRLKEMLR